MIPVYVRGLVGITGSRYQPLDNQHQIHEALEKMILAINITKDAYTKALMVLLGISYIQPFVDGNKRTARLITNGLLNCTRNMRLCHTAMSMNVYTGQHS